VSPLHHVSSSSCLLFIMSLFFLLIFAPTLPALLRYTVSLSRWPSHLLCDTAACSAISTPYLRTLAESSRHRGRHRGERLKRLLYHNLSGSQRSVHITRFNVEYVDAQEIRQSLHNHFMLMFASACICREAKRSGEAGWFTA
jgi:hypothetical protein